VAVVVDFVAALEAVVKLVAVVEVEQSVAYFVQLVVVTADLLAVV